MYVIVFTYNIYGTFNRYPKNLLHTYRVSVQRNNTISIQQLLYVQLNNPKQKPLFVACCTYFSAQLNAQRSTPVFDGFTIN